MSQKEREAEVKAAFVDYLVQHGYPRDAIVFDQPLGAQHSVTLTISDPDKQQHLAYFQIRGKFNYVAMDRYEVDAFQQLRTLDAIARPTRAKVYMVSAAQKPTAEFPFDIHYLNDNGAMAQLTGDEFPSYGGLCAAVLSVRSRRRAQPTTAGSTASARAGDAFQSEQLERSEPGQRPRERDSFQDACWMLASFCLLLGLVDFLCAMKGYLLINGIRFWLVVLSVALVLLSFWQKSRLIGHLSDRLARRDDPKDPR